MSNRETILNYIKKDNSGLNPLKEFNISGIVVKIEQRTENDLEIINSIKYVVNTMPNIFYKNIKYILVGNYDILTKRELDAFYDSNTIYLKAHYENNEKVISDIVHEICHSFEEYNKQYLYDDETIEKEFLSKRETLYRLLQTNNLIFRPISKAHFETTQYQLEFDNYLYNTIGYEKISNFTNGLFISPYAATSLKEYLANAFEHFFVNDIFIVKKISPSIYNKLIGILEI